MLSFKNHIQFIFLGALIALVQILFFNNTNLFSWLNPLIYSIYVFLFPTNKRMSLIIYSFLLGLSLDMFFNTGGINAFSLTFIAYLREPLWRTLSLIKNDRNSIATKAKSSTTFFFSLFILIIIHHFVLFSIENFDLTTLHLFLIKILLSSSITFGIILLIYSIFRIKIINGED